MRVRVCEGEDMNVRVVGVRDGGWRVRGCECPAPLGRPSCDEYSLLLYSVGPTGIKRCDKDLDMELVSISTFFSPNSTRCEMRSDY